MASRIAWYAHVLDRGAERLSRLARHRELSPDQEEQIEHDQASDLALAVARAVTRFGELELD